VKRRTFDKTAGRLVGEEFWAADEVESEAPAPPSRIHRHRPKKERLLTRDEIIIPDVYGGVLGEWRRDQGYFMYLLFKGAPGRPPKGIMVLTGAVVGICVVIAALMTIFGSR